MKKLSYRNLITALIIAGPIFSGNLWAGPFSDKKADNKSEVKEAVVYIHGKPIFPFGFYFEHGGSTEFHIQGLKDMAEMGFNTSFVTLYSDNTRPLSEVKQIYDAAHDVGIGLIAEGGFHTYNGITGVEALKDHPGVLAWSAGDDIIERDPEEIRMNVERIDRLDPNHFTYISSNGTQRDDWGKIENFSYTGIDAMAVQIYPIPQPRHWWVAEPGKQDLRLVYYRCKRTVDAYEKLGVAPFANVQAFKWWFEENDRYPTVEETDIMVYQTIVAGVKGLLAYTYRGCCEDQTSAGLQYASDNATYFDIVPGMREKWIQLNSEIQEMSPFLLLGKRNTLTIDPYFDFVFSSTWEKDGKLLVIVSNAAKEHKPAEIPLQNNIKPESLQNKFESRKGTLQIEKGFLVGDMAPLSTHIYEITLK